MTETGIPHQLNDEQAASPLATAIGKLINNGFIITIAPGPNPMRHHLLVYRSGGGTAINKLSSNIESLLLELAGIESEADQRRRDG